MITLLQRVTQARVEVGTEVIAEIKAGILVLVGVQADDDETTARSYVERLLNYRVFADSEGKMNLSLKDIDGGLLLVPQFTLAANTKKGRRPSFVDAAPPEIAEPLYEKFVIEAAKYGIRVAAGLFGADMQVTIVNDGPVTLVLESW